LGEFGESNVGYDSNMHALKSTHLCLSGDSARTLLGAAAGTTSIQEVSFDLNLSTTLVAIDGDRFRVGERKGLLQPLRNLAKEDRKVFRASGSPMAELVETWEPMSVFEGGYYQLVATAEAPTVEIDGVQMHITSGVGPFAAAGAFAATVVRPGDRVLDTCGGLGYTAIQALLRGAVQVDSFELSAAMLQLRTLNPWSQWDCGGRLHLTHGDVFQATVSLRRGSYDVVLHDPPRQALAPDLYSDAFYLRLRDLLKPDGRLFHYTGDPRSRSRSTPLARSVLDRLGGLGFSGRVEEDVQGVVASLGRVPWSRRGRRH